MNRLYTQNDPTERDAWEISVRETLLGGVCIYTRLEDFDSIEDAERFRGALDRCIKYARTMTDENSTERRVYDAIVKLKDEDDSVEWQKVQAETGFGKSKFDSACLNLEILGLIADSRLFTTDGNAVLKVL